MGVRTEWGHVDKTRVEVVPEHTDQYAQSIEPNRIGLAISTDEVLLLEADDLDGVRAFANRILDACDTFEHGEAESTCRHCQRHIILRSGTWVDPEAAGDDSMWRETCGDNHEDRVAEHEPSL